MEELIEQLKLQIDKNPETGFEHGWNTGLKYAIRQLEAAQQQRAADFATPCENCGTVGPHDCDEPEERRITQIG